MTFFLPRAGEPVTVFTTVHGSHLYGLDHPGSDRDWFTVTTSSAHRARQHVHPDGTDTASLGFEAFLRRALSGSHQSVEALFSPYQQWESHLELRPFVDELRIGGGEVSAKYERTIRSFSAGDYKKRRHAARLALNLDQLRRYGRFDPVLSDTETDFVTQVAVLEGDALLEALFTRLPRFPSHEDERRA